MPIKLLLIAKLSCLALLLLVTATPDLTAQGPLLDEILEKLPPAAKPKPPLEPAAEAEPKDDEDAEEAKEDKDAAILDKFFQELQAAVDGNDDRTKAIKELLAELKTQYQDLELQLADNRDTETLDRMLTVAQYYQNLKTRMTSRDSRRVHEVHRLISERVRKFRREHSDLARKPEFQQREAAIRNQAMQANRFGMNSQMPGAITQTMRNLSANNQVVDRWGPRALRAHPGEVDGAIQNARVSLRRMLRLRWHDGLLVLDREHWDHAFAGHSMEDIQADVTHLLEKRGVAAYGSDDERERMMRMRVRGLPQGPNPVAQLGRLFQEFYEGGGRSYSGGGTSGSWSTRSATSSIQVDANPTDFNLTYTELQHPKRVLRVQANGKESLSVLLLGKLIHRFHQYVDASGNTHLQVTEILDDEIVNLKAADFAQLYRENPRFVESRLFPLFEHLGIIPPLSRFDAEVTTRVSELLTTQQESVRREFETIIQGLDVNKFTQREAAFRKLRDNLDQYLPLLFEKSRDKSLSREARARIQKLVEAGGDTGLAELDATIGSLELLTDSSYLSELAGTVSGETKQVLQERIQRLADQPE